MAVMDLKESISSYMTLKKTTNKKERVHKNQQIRALLSNERMVAINRSR